MYKLIYHIIKGTLGILLVVLAVANAAAQKPVPHYEVTQCDTLIMSVDDWPGDRYTWDIYRDSTVNYATEKGDVGPVPYFVNDMYEGSTVKVVDLEPGSYFLRVMAWDEVLCTNNLLVFKFDVIENIPMVELMGDSLCIGDPAVVRLVFTGTGPWNFVYTYGDDENAVNGVGHSDEPEYLLPILKPLPEGDHTFWIMELSDNCTVISYPVEEERPKTGILIYPKPTNSRIYQQDN